MKNFLRNHAVLVTSLGLSLILIIGRVLYTRELSFIFLVWNLFLACIPYLVVLFIRNRSKLFRVPGLLLCILFLPNAPYMITDLFHLRGDMALSIWFDTLLIASFAWNGLLLFFHTLRQLEFLIAKRWDMFYKIVGVGVLSLLCGFGIYVGRYLRFNSWDVFTQPVQVFTEVLSHLIDPLSHPRTWAMTLTYSLFLTVAYYNFAGMKSKEELAFTSTGDQ